MTTRAFPLPRPSQYVSGVLSWLTTIDHKRIGILYGVTAFILFFSGGIEAALIRVQLAQADLDIVSPEVFNQLFTMHGTTMIFLAIMPMSAAFFNFVVPLQIGARDVAFPRLNAFSYWMFLAGAIMLKASWFLGDAPNTGWFSYAPLTSLGQNPTHGVDFWIMSLLLLGIASLAASFNFLITIINMRAPGMGFMKMPLFVWMTFITNVLIVLAFPVITVALIQLFLDRNYGFNFFDISFGANPVLWQHLFWVFGHPEVYILILPSMGIVSEILPTFSKKPLFGYATVVLAGSIIAFMGWMVWSHHMFTVGLGPITNSVFAITTMTIAVPTGVKIFNWIATMWGGHLDFKTPMLFAVGFIVMFTIGGVSGIMHAVAPSDAQQQDTYFIVAHIHYVLFGGSIFALIGGVYYWFPKFTGRMYNEFLGKISFWFIFIGFNVTFFPMHLTGLLGMPRRVYTYTQESGWEWLNLISSIGVVALTVGLLVFIGVITYYWRKGEDAPGDPWDGRTLEWSIASPPPEYNFVEIPTVYDRDDWWATKRRTVTRGVPVGGGSGEEGHSIHLPQPSYWPLIASIGILVMAYGLIYSIPVAVIGALIGVISIYAWSFEPVNDPEETENSAH